MVEDARSSGKVFFAIDDYTNPKILKELERFGFYSGDWKIETRPDPDDSGGIWEFFKERKGAKPLRAHFHLSRGTDFEFAVWLDE